MRPNKLRELLKAGKSTIGTRVHCSWPSMIEALGHTGMYDYVEFLAEYAPFDLHGLDNFCRAAELYNMGTTMKVDQDPRMFLAQRAIGAGFQGILFADCRSAEDVQECVRIARAETPDDDGSYGVAMRRFAYMGYGGSVEYVQALKDIVVLIMIEKRSAVEQLEEILKVDGVDMIQWGSADYAMSIGRAGERNSTEIKNIGRKVFETAYKMGIPARAEIKTVDQAKYYQDLGVRHFNIGTDISILHNWWKTNGEELRKVVTG